jgi:hypothetical protein
MISGEIWRKILFCENEGDVEAKISKWKENVHFRFYFVRKFLESANRNNMSKVFKEVR